MRVILEMTVDLSVRAAGVMHSQNVPPAGASKHVLQYLGSVARRAILDDAQAKGLQVESDVNVSLARAKLAPDAA